MTNPSPTSPIKNEVYAIFCGDINFANSQKLTQSLTGAIAGGYDRVHLLFHTFGGFVGDGIYMHNLFKNLPVEVIIYNGGQVASAGVLAFLGAKKRVTAPNGIFMIHKSQNSVQFASAAKLKTITSSLVLDDARSDALFREHLQLPKEILEQLEHHDVHLSAEDGINFGLAQELGHFSPPIGTKVFNALP